MSAGRTRPSWPGRCARAGSCATAAARGYGTCRVLLVDGDSSRRAGPIDSMAADIAGRRNTRPVTLFFGVRTAADLFHLDRLDAIRGRMPGLKIVPVLSEPGRLGRRDGARHRRGGPPAAPAERLRRLPVRPAGHDRRRPGAGHQPRGTRAQCLPRRVRAHGLTGPRALTPRPVPAKDLYTERNMVHPARARNLLGSM